MARSRRPRWPRRLLALGALVLVIAAGVAVASRELGGDGGVADGSSAARGATIARYAIHSRYVHRRLPQVTVRPRAARARPALLVFLHGRGTHGSESNVNGAFLAALAALGPRAPAVVFPDGGEASYWHRRRSGDWGRYVLDEVIPAAIRRLHADPRRVAIGGISMGGFGAYDLARLHPHRFCAVGGHSPALWLRGGDTAPGAFDDAADFARHDVVALARRSGRAPWGRARLWLDGGTADPFRPGGEALARALGIRMHHWPGGHDFAYWQAHYGAYLRFYAKALAACPA
jgi:S-formylglutathione hydrolase FrmB